jgi:hypothetical protein
MRCKILKNAAAPFIATKSPATFSRDFLHGNSGITITDKLQPIRWHCYQFIE